MPDFSIKMPTNIDDYHSIRKYGAELQNAIVDFISHKANANRDVATVQQSLSEIRNKAVVQAAQNESLSTLKVAEREMYAKQNIQVNVKFSLANGKEYVLDTTYNEFKAFVSAVIARKERADDTFKVMVETLKFCQSFPVRGV